MENRFLQVLEALGNEGKLTFEREKPLSSCSTFRIGGPVEYAVYPKSVEALSEVFRAAKDEGVPVRVVGNASNILFPDEGVRGAIVFTTALTGTRFSGGVLTAFSGEGVTGLAVKAQKKGYSGIEFLYGIPGSVGGAVYMNAGAYEHSIDEVLVSSSYFDPSSEAVGSFKGAEHEFSYRHSVYAGTGLVILGAVLKLTKDDPGAIRERMEAYMTARKSKQPLEYPSAGSVFKRYPGYFTAKLIDEAGLKGYTVGGAQVSLKHAGFIINIGGATSSDVKTLVAHIQNEIFLRHGIRIEREVIYF